MWQRWLRELSVELYWLKKDIIRRWHLDTPVGVVGILALTSGLIFLVILGQGLASLFQNMIPWVAGSRAGEVYWSSVGFSIKASFVFLIFCCTLIVFILLKIFNHR